MPRKKMDVYNQSSTAKNLPSILPLHRNGKVGPYRSTPRPGRITSHWRVCVSRCIHRIGNDFIANCWTVPRESSHLVGGGTITSSAVVTTIVSSKGERTSSVIDCVDLFYLCRRKKKNCDDASCHGYRSNEKTFIDESLDPPNKWFTTRHWLWSGSTRQRTLHHRPNTCHPLNLLNTQ